ATNTSADFVLRFRRTDGRVHVVLGEWKYTESYGQSDLAVTAGSGSGDVRLDTYRAAYCRTGGTFSDHGPDLYRALFFEPLYQLMRLQLLAQEMEQARELGADIVSVLHVSPEANREFQAFNPSPHLRERFPGKGALEAWRALVPADRFVSLSVESLRAAIGQEARSISPEWVTYLDLRYGWE
ncbi:MAG: PGN_0703 family putative restriction endonuclease, partial [Chloroflexota bacterium]